MNPLILTLSSIHLLRSSSLPFILHHTASTRALNFSVSVSRHQYSFASSPRRPEEESRNVRVSVWWDFENCSIPVCANVFKIANHITAAIRANGIKGPIQITAFGDVFQLSRTNQEALSSTGINLAHIPHGGKNSADRSLLVDLMYWVSQNPPPAHLFLISGDRDFSGILYRLRMSNYNILLASRESAPIVLCGAASIMWHWNSLARGENLIGKHYNLPPDGPYNSWYGHQRAALTDPYTAIELSPKNKEISESSVDFKPRPIPKTVLKQIQQILSYFPKGLSIIDLRSELGKSSVNLDKDLYGYKKFSRFLLSMSNILRLQPGGDGQVFVHRVSPPGVDGLAPNSEAANVKSKVNDERATDAKSSNETIKAQSSLQSCAESDIKKTPIILNQTDNAAKVDTSVSDVCAPEGNQTVKASSPSEAGFFMELWAKWFGGRSGSKLILCSNEAATELNNTMTPSSHSSSNDMPVHDGQNKKTSEESDSKFDNSSSFFSKLYDWWKCRFWRKSEAFEASSGHSMDEDRNALTCELFSEEVWNEVESFLSSPEGIASISTCKTREKIADSLQKNGPPALKSLHKSETLHLVDLMISEKKWINEVPSGSLPFKVAVNKDSNTDVRSSKGLRSLFTADSSQSTKQLKGDSSVSKRKKKSRDEILSDCRMLVTKILKDHPEGSNISMFPKLFIETYGYSLDYQMLGYHKLSSLFQIIPGVSIESKLMVPSVRHAKDSNAGEVGNNYGDTIEAVSDHELRKDDEDESPWEELGPISGSNADALSGSTQNLSGSTQKDEERVAQNCLDEYLVSEDEHSDDGAEAVSMEQKNIEKKEEQSSLLQILDSWYSPKEENSRREELDGTLIDSMKLSDSWRGGLSGESSLMNSLRKPKPSKCYSFVADSGSSEKDKLVDGTLSSLKRSGEART